ncbi:MAG: NAD-dependent epimerase/dehydratase family protein [Verrucomicrobia bacterium]|nr:NAD-dependent epimerase/dehydratase family protein [Verrucomicrobiota bacterium]
MGSVVVTGSGGLIGSECARHFHDQGLHVVGIDNDMRRYFFGEEGSTRWVQEQLLEACPNAVFYDADIRDEGRINQIFSDHGSDIELVIHTAAQPSHDWAAREPITDFTVNANGTLVLLEAARQHCHAAPFIFTSTNKVYGDGPNRLPYVEQETRWELDPSHPYAARGIDESMSIDACLHSLFGASKVAADILVQEYGRYFGMKTTVFRGGCLTGPAHSAVELHGFLAYLMRCAVVGRPYKIFGYKGKQVRDNISSSDLVCAFDHVFRSPRSGEVYNIGGSRFSHCSLREAVSMCEEITGKKMNVEHEANHRMGDHQWYVSDIAKFQSHYPEWRITRTVKEILVEIYHSGASKWAAE